MDNEMIERVAKAMFDKACPAIRYTDDDRLFYSDMAIAAIKAMRKPTQKMIEDGMWISTTGEIVGEYGAKETYQAMIDAIIGDK